MNNSGIEPSGDRIVVKPDQLEKVTAGGILIPEPELEKHQNAQALGTLVAVGPDAFSHTTEYVYKVHDDGKQQLVEKRIKGYSEPFAKPGDRVMFARYAGMRVVGEDGEQYCVLNDEDITAKASENIDLTEFRSREPIGKARRQGQ